MRILLWHVHGSWTTAFVQGNHDVILPVLPGRGADGRGRARTWQWPSRVVERSPEQLADEPVDLVILQRPHEIELVRRWLGRTPGVDLPAVYLEHNAPEPHSTLSRHPMADQDAIPVVHVTHFNALFWDNGRAATRVIEHGVIDPGHRFSGSIARAAVVTNDPLRRGRMVGTDLLPHFASQGLDVFGMGVADLPTRPGLRDVRVYDDLPQHRMHDELAERRVYLHPVRWTSLGLSLIEAMQLGLPVVALASTEVVAAVPPGAGVVATDLELLVLACREFLADADAARAAGQLARTAALARYGLPRFLDDWDVMAKEAVA